MKSTNLDTNGVFGAQAGTLLKGPKTKRQGNPLDGNYQYPGWTELKDNINPYSLTKKEDAKKASTLQKTGAQAMGITEKKSEAPFGIDMVPEHKQGAFKDSYAKFYGEEDNAGMKKLNFSKLHAASRTAGAGDPLAAVKPELKADPAFKKNMKVFFQNEVSDTASQYGVNQARFFADAAKAEGKSLKPAEALQDKFQNV